MLNMDISWQPHKIGKCLLVYVYESVSFILTFNLLWVHGFNIVIVTHLYARSEKMSVSQKLRDYFSESIQPLATNECLEQMFQKLKEEIVKKFEERFIQQNRKIDELEERVSFQENTINQLLIKCDDNEQNSRRNCLQIHGIEYKNSEKIDDVRQKVSASAIFTRRYRSCSSNWNGVHGVKFSKESKIHYSEIQVAEGAKTILRC